MTFSKRILSGIQPSGDLHIGNYLGAIKNFVSLQEEYECFFCVVDLHAITVWQDPKQLSNNIRQVIAAFIASGIDPNKNVLYYKLRNLQNTYSLIDNLILNPAIAYYLILYIMIKLECSL